MGYSNKTLLGNWFEDQCAPRLVTRTLRVRRAEKDLPAVRLKRISEESTHGTLADTAFNDWSTTNLTDLRAPSPQISIISASEKKLIRRDNFVAQKLSRKVDGPTSGFQATIPRHGRTEMFSNFSSSVHSAHGGLFADDPSKRIAPGMIDRSIAAGIELNSKPREGPIDIPGLDATSLYLPSCPPVLKIKKRQSGIQIWLDY